MTKEKNTIDDLLKAHGKRAQPDDLMKKRAMKNVKAHWQANLEKQHMLQKQRQSHLFKIAASIMIIVSAVFLMQYSFQDSNLQVIKGFYANGDVQISNDGINWQTSNQQSLVEDAWVKTNDNSYVSLTLMDNSQLRLNHNTQLQLLNASQVTLHNGEIYHDADDTSKSNPLKINTSLGNIQHIGTRYLVNKTESDLQVSVRDGIVEISNDDFKKQIVSGKQLSMDVNGTLNENNITTYDVLWKWTQDAGKPFQAKNKSLNDFIVWFAHENGYEIDWNKLQDKTKRVQLSGNISDLSKSQQIKAIFLSTKFDYQINQVILSIL
jgi:hypothetical protein